MSLLRLITAFVAAQGMTETRFGREAVGDPRFVHDLKRGRLPREPMESRVRAYIARNGGAL